MMGADILPTQGARPSATMMYTIVNKISSVPARQALKIIDVCWAPPFRNMCEIKVQHSGINNGSAPAYQPGGRFKTW